MGKREEVRLLNRRGHAPKLETTEFSSVAGVTTGWLLAWDDTKKGFIASDPTAAGSGAPTTASYVVMGLDASLTNERRLQGGNGIGLADGGANGDATLSIEFASEAQGDIIYRDASDWARLPAGSAGEVLTSGGPAANPSWAAAAGGGFDAKLYIASSQSIVSGTTLAVGQVEFNPNDFTGYSTVKFGGTVATSTTASVVSLKLRNKPENQLIATLTTDSTAHTLLVSGALTVGGGAGEIRNGSQIYEVQLQTTAGIGHLGTAFILVE